MKLALAILRIAIQMALWIKMSAFRETIFIVTRSTYGVFIPPQFTLTFRAILVYCSPRGSPGETRANRPARRVTRPPAERALPLDLGAPRRSQPRRAKGGSTAAPVRRHCSRTPLSCCVRTLNLNTPVNKTKTCNESRTRCENDRTKEEKARRDKLGYAAAAERIRRSCVDVRQFRARFTSTHELVKK